MSPELSVVVPVHNEVDNVAPLLSEIRAALDGQIDYEIICVDDGSNDRTAQCLSSLVACCPQLRIIHHLRRAGQSAAVVSGVRLARGAWIATLDGDGQNNPADIPPLLTVLRDPTAPRALRLVIGKRHRRRDALAKRFASRMANMVRVRVLGDATPDTGCGLKVFSRDAFLSIPHFDHMHRFLPALFLRSGWHVVSVPVDHRPRRHGRSHYGLLDRLWAGIIDLAGVVWLKHRAIRVMIVEEPNER